MFCLISFQLISLVFRIGALVAEWRLAPLVHKAQESGLEHSRSDSLVAVLLPSALHFDRQEWINNLRRICLERVSESNIEMRTDHCYF